VSFPLIFDGQWVRPRRRKGYIIECCQCGLRHRLNFRLVKGHLEFQPFRLRPRKRKR
jgi:hypothetical protein